MNIKALCPACGVRVPRIWFVQRKVRPCCQCSSPIKANDAEDTRFSVILGSLSGLLFTSSGILAGYFAFGYAGAWAGLILGCATAAVIGSFIAFWLFPYFVSFDLRT